MNQFIFTDFMGNSFPVSSVAYVSKIVDSGTTISCKIYLRTPDNQKFNELGGTYSKPTAETTKKVTENREALLKMMNEYEMERLRKHVTIEI